MTEAFPTDLRLKILNNEQFIEAIFHGKRRGGILTWQRVAIRPVILKGIRHLQFSYQDGVQDKTFNLLPNDATSRVDELLTLPLKSIQVNTRDETIRVQFSKKGRPIIHLSPGEDRHAIPLSLAHDREKPVILDEKDAMPFLRTIGIMTADGRIRADQQRKFRQINEFMRLIEETGPIELPERGPLRVVDLGCGSAALTFATYHYLAVHMRLPATMIGVDTKAHLLDRHRRTAEQLGWEGVSFEAARIQDFQPDVPPDIVLALHACDTATDEALSRAVSWRSKLILSAPCCHHHLQAQLSATKTPEPFRPVVRHGILRERLGDVLTDAFRAHILRLMGYRTEVLEFVPIEHTPKNLMIRAVRNDVPPTHAQIAEYLALKTFWGVTPYLETLLGEPFQQVLLKKPANT